MAITITNAQTSYSGSNGWVNSTDNLGQTLKCGLNINSNLVWVTKLTFTLDETLPVGSQISFVGNVLSGTSETARMYIISQTSDTITGAQAAVLTDDNLPTGTDTYSFAKNSADTPYTRYNYNHIIHTEMLPGTYYGIIRRSTTTAGYHEMENPFYTNGSIEIITPSTDASNVFIKVNGHWEPGKMLTKANGTWT